jgi:hypothetical protein
VSDEKDVDDDSEDSTQSTGLVLVPIRSPLNPDLIRTASAPFLDWLGQSAVYEMESQLKSTLLLTESQLRQPRNDLRFLMQAANTTDYATLLQAQIIQPIFASLIQTGKGADRIYQLSLLARKLLVFLFSQQSKLSNAVINPSVHASWRILDRYSHDATKKRKLNQRNRMVLGNNDDSDIMTEEEMVILQRGCLSTMDKLEATPGHRFPLTIAQSWQRCFITLLFLDLIGPRSQTMASLSTDTLLRPNAPNNTSAGLWQVRIPAEKSKSGQPVLMDVPALLSPRLDVLFNRVLPPDWTGPLFIMRNGKVRTDFTD